MSLKVEIETLFVALQEYAASGDTVVLLAQENKVCQLALMGLGVVLQAQGLIQEGGMVLNMKPAEVLKFQHRIKIAD